MCKDPEGGQTRLIELPENVWVDWVDELPPNRRNGAKWRWLYELIRNMKPDGKALRVTLPSKERAKRAQHVARSRDMAHCREWRQKGYRIATRTSAAKDGAWCLFVGLRRIEQ